MSTPSIATPAPAAPPAPLAAHLREFAPDFARRFAAITSGLGALVAHAFLHDPRVVLLIVPLWSRLNRASRHCTSLMATLAAGRRPRPYRFRPHRSPQPQPDPESQPDSADAPRPARPPAPAIPRTKAWLFIVLRHQAGAYASRLALLLAEPGAAELLAAAPTTARFLRPLCRMLAVDFPDARQSRAATQAAAARPARQNPAAQNPAGQNPAGQKPAGDKRPESPHTPHPESAPAPSSPRPNRPPPTRFKPKPILPDIPWLDALAKKFA